MTGRSTPALDPAAYLAAEAAWIAHLRICDPCRRSTGLPRCEDGRRAWDSMWRARADLDRTDTDASDLTVSAF